MLQELEEVGYALERAKTVAKNRMRWRILLDGIDDVSRLHVGASFKFSQNFNLLTFIYT